MTQSTSSCTRTAEVRPQLLVLACCRVCWALPDRQRAGGRRARCVLKMRGRELTTVVGFVARLRCVEAGAVAWRFGPTHACQGVGCRYCDGSVLGDGRGSCGRTLGRGIRPALNPLLNDGLGETPLAAGRRSAPHGRMRTIPGANDIYRDRTARSRSWLRPWVASWPPVRGDRDLCLMRAEIARRYCRCRQATHGRSQLRERAVQSL